MATSRPLRVGVDLGSTAVRVVVVSGLDDYGYARVVRAACVPVTDGAVIAGEVRQPVVVAKALATAMSETRAPRRGVVLGIASRNMAVKQILAPTAVRPSERAASLRMSRQEVSPAVPLSDSALSWNTMRNEVTGEGRTMTEINVAVALRSEIEMLDRVCRLAGVVPGAVDLSAAALLRALVRVADQDRDIATVVDIGATKTLVATREGPWLRSVRIAPVGGQAATRALMTAMDVSVDEAENRKRFMRLPGAGARPRIRDHGGYAGGLDEAADPADPATTAEEALAQAAGQLVEEVAKAVAADARDRGARQPRGIQLTGGGARLGGLPDRIADRVGLPVAPMAPWATLELARSGIHAPDESQLPELSTAIGLALWTEPS